MIGPCMLLAVVVGRPVEVFNSPSTTISEIPTDKSRSRSQRQESVPIYCTNAPTPSPSRSPTIFCGNIPCAQWCSGRCGWSSRRGLCQDGSFTNEDEFSNQYCVAGWTGTVAPVTSEPSTSPTMLPTSRTASPIRCPTPPVPTRAPLTSMPTFAPSHSPITAHPSRNPTTSFPTPPPTHRPSSSPTTPFPTRSPSSSSPTRLPSRHPTPEPTTQIPSISPSTPSPTQLPSGSPSNSPTITRAPTVSPSAELCSVNIAGDEICQTIWFQYTLVQQDRCENRAFFDDCSKLCCAGPNIMSTDAPIPSLTTESPSGEPTRPPSVSASTSSQPSSIPSYTALHTAFTSLFPGTTSTFALSTATSQIPLSTVESTSSTFVDGESQAPSTSIRIPIPTSTFSPSEISSSSTSPTHSTAIPGTTKPPSDQLTFVPSGAQTSTIFTSSIQSPAFSPEAPTQAPYLTTQTVHTPTFVSTQNPPTTTTLTDSGTDLFVSVYPTGIVPVLPSEVPSSVPVELSTPPSPGNSFLSTSSTTVLPMPLTSTPQSGVGTSSASAGSTYTQSGLGTQSPTASPTLLSVLVGTLEESNQEAGSSDLWSLLWLLLFLLPCGIVYRRRRPLIARSAEADISGVNPNISDVSSSSIINKEQRAAPRFKRSPFRSARDTAGEQFSDETRGFKLWRSRRGLPPAIDSDGAPHSSKDEDADDMLHVNTDDFAMVSETKFDSITEAVSTGPGYALQPDIGDPVDYQTASIGKAEATDSHAVDTAVDRAVMEINDDMLDPDNYIDILGDAVPVYGTCRIENESAVEVECETLEVNQIGKPHFAQVKLNTSMDSTVAYKNGETWYAKLERNPSYSVDASADWVAGEPTKARLNDVTETWNEPDSLAHRSSSYNNALDEAIA